MSNYPPGTGPGDPNAPWNAPDPPECEECGGVYAEDGHRTIEDAPKECHECGHSGFDLGDFDGDLGCEVCPECGSEDISHVPCPNAGMDMADYEDGRRSQAAEDRFDALRDEGKL